MKSLIVLSIFAIICQIGFSNPIMSDQTTFPIFEDENIRNLTDREIVCPEHTYLTECVSYSGTYPCCKPICSYNNCE